MGWKVIFAPRAHARLAKIVRFIATDDPQAAIRFGDYLVDRAESLCGFQNWEPRIGNDRTCGVFCVNRISFTIASVEKNR